LRGLALMVPRWRYGLLASTDAFVSTEFVSAHLKNRIIYK
jgi:hypothetical protein